MPYTRTHLIRIHTHTLHSLIGHTSRVHRLHVKTSADNQSMPARVLNIGHAWHDIPTPPGRDLLCAGRRTSRKPEHCSRRRKNPALSSDVGRPTTYHQSPEMKTTYWWESTNYKEHTYLHWKQKLEKGASGKGTPLRAPPASSA